MKSHYNWLIYNVLDRELETAAIRYAKGRLLDIGCGVKPYRNMLSPYVTEHVGVDQVDTIHPKSQVNIFCSVYALPCRDESFDTVLCTEVLEHIEEPKKAIAEMFRVLKKGGFCILTTPFFWHLHEAPRDFFRYSRYGLQYLFESTNFTIIEIKAISGFWVTMMQETAYYLHKFGKQWLLKLPAYLLIWIVQTIGYVLDAIDRDENFATEYIVIAKKS